MTRRYVHETHTSLPQEKLYRAIIAVRRWPEWDSELESIEYDGPPLKAGSVFFLKPKGGPRTRMKVESAIPPQRFVDVALLPFGRMQTSHDFMPTASGTMVRVVIETSGPLAILWDRVIARKQAAGAAEQSSRFLAFAATM